MATIAAAAIGAGATLYAANKAKKAASKLGKSQDELNAIQIQNAKMLQPYAGKFYDEAWRAYQPTMDYYKTVASGDRSRVLGALAPQLSDIGRKYSSIRNTMATLQPRGGRSAAAATELAYRAGDEKQALVSRESAGAWDKLVQLAAMGGNLGGAAAGMSTGAAAGASKSQIDGATFLSSLQTNPSAAYADLGKALVGMFGKDAKGWYVSGSSGSGSPGHG